MAKSERRASKRAEGRRRSPAAVQTGTPYQQLFTLYDKRDWAALLAERAASEEEPDGSSRVLLAAGVSDADFIRFEEKVADSKAAGRGKVYMCLQNSNLFIYDLPFDRHEVPKSRFESQLDSYADAQRAQAGPGAPLQFITAGSSFYGIVAGTRRQPDAALLFPDGLFPVIVGEFGAAESIKDLDEDAQEWLQTSTVRAVLIARVYPRRPPGGDYAAFAALYVKGAEAEAVPATGAPPRTINPGTPPGTAPVAAWSFGTAPLPAAAAGKAAALGAAVTGIGFGEGAAPLCTAAGMPAFRVTIPGATIYHGAPAGTTPPDGNNDFHFDLFDIVERLAHRQF